MPDDVWLIDLDTNRVSGAHKHLWLWFQGTVRFHECTHWKIKNAWPQSAFACPILKLRIPFIVVSQDPISFACKAFFYN